MNDPETEPLGMAAPAQAPEPLKIPWEDPGESRLVALPATVWQLLSRPGEFFRLISREGWQQSLSFGLIVGSFGLRATFYTEMLLSLSLSQRVESLPVLSQLMAQTSGLWVVLMLLTPFLISVSLLRFGDPLAVGGPAPAGHSRHHSVGAENHPSRRSSSISWPTAGRTVRRASVSGACSS